MQETELKKKRTIRKRRFKQKNGSTRVESTTSIRYRRDVWLTNGEVRESFCWEARFHYGDKIDFNYFKEKNHAELWLKDMLNQYKYKTMGTNYLKQYEELTKNAAECLNNSNVMLETPIVGYYAVEADGSYAECKMLGVCNGVVFTKVADEEKEHKVVDVFEELEHRSVFRLCDEVSKY